MIKPRIIRPRKISPSSLKVGPFYTVASVELGNTTTKCIIVTTNLETAEIFEVAKEIRMTRDVRPPREDESSFGETIAGVALTEESVSEMIADILRSAVSEAKIDLERDLHFVVRSTGVNAGFTSPEEVQSIIKALAQGCLDAGVPPRRMTASMSPENLPPGIREFTWLKKVYFDGAIASCLPPANTEIVANEMEGELVTAGIKGAVKGTDVDFRNPVLTLDFGTTLAGRVVDDSYPYARTVGSFAGLAGAIPDALAKGSGLTNRPDGVMSDLSSRSTRTIDSNVKSWVKRLEKIIRVEEVPEGVDRYGTVPVNTDAAAESGTLLIGVDVGANGSNLPLLSRHALELVEEGGRGLLLAVVDLLMARLAYRLISMCDFRGLILPETSFGLTGRALTTGQKPELLLEELVSGKLMAPETSRQAVFVEDGLAMGAAVAARCMNSMGTRENPMGGRKGDSCIMGARMKLQRD
ncbi:methanogenesis marker 14 protein [Candidatus Thorarchaeota archaeon]|nr:MAG: methanogenesis marker 14 protein [Candidatus Thorarchaeota archaeon]